tara:strand:- start:722 stop:2782 length:2061 start_codon:yes stop_codon:yes gene_type:complete
MDERVKKLLTGTKSQLDVDETQDLSISLDSKYKHIDEDVISKIISTNAQFEKERQESGIYRFYGNIKSLVSNVLFNDNLKIYQRDGATQTKKTKSSNIIERDGWLGYIDNDEDTAQTYEKSNDKINDNKSSLCEFIPFSPGYNRLKFDDPDGLPNYIIKVTYPYKKEDINFIDNVSLTGDGINIIDSEMIESNGYTSFNTVISHGLSVGDIVKLKNSSKDGEYQVVGLGNNNGNGKSRFFILDIPYVESNISKTKTTFKRIVNGLESEYYVRKFKSLSNGFKDYDSYPAAFAETYYGDEEVGFNFTKDIDVNGVVDNLGRPLSELFLTIVKVDTDSSNDFKDTYWKGLTKDNSSIPVDLQNRFWTHIQGGFFTENRDDIKYNVRSISADGYEQTHFGTVDSGIDESDIDFVGDIVEYNEEELIERTLESTYHRINTVYREYRKDILNLSSTDGEYEVDDLREGYIYRPHYRVKIREFSSTIRTTESAKISTTNGDVVLGDDDIPDYAILTSTEVKNIVTDDTDGLGDEIGRGNTDNVFEEPVGFNPWTTIETYKYRSLLDIGVYNTFGDGVDYPFKSGAHYMYMNINFFLERQDPPFNENNNEVDLTLPGDVDTFNFLVNSPNYVDFRVTSGSVGSNEQIDGDTNSVTLTVTLKESDGIYDLGDRHISGIPTNLPAITIKDISNVC